MFNDGFGNASDPPLERYRASYEYRTLGAARAARLGAVAVLVRSRTDRSLYTPHTGVMRAVANGTNIPAAAITVEDAHSIARHAARGACMPTAAGSRGGRTGADRRHGGRVERTDRAWQAVTNRKWDIEKTMRQ